MTGSMFDKIRDQKILPAITFHDLNHVAPVCEALSRAGITTMEIAVRTDIAFDAIKMIRNQFPGLTIGAGTILSILQLRAAIDAGAMFGLSPSLNINVVKEAVRHGFSFIPGVMTPSEIESACESGCKVQKLFPASAIGGISFLKAMHGPYAHLNLMFIPMGGVNLHNMNDYLQLANVIAVGGSWLVPDASVKARNFSIIEQNAVDALEMIRKN